MWIEAVVGGILIGLAAVLLMGFTGRVAGISGIVWQAFRFTRDGYQSWLFVIGVFFGAYLISHFTNHVTPQVPDSPTWLIILAGGLVGFGSRMGSGCTSGHGVCGIGRLSKRSFLATSTFLSVAIAAASVVGGVL